jgi:hypothetical protein
MHDYYRDCTNELKASWNERKRRSFIPIMFCIALTVTGLWFPSWHMYIVIMILFVIIWALTRFMMKGEN